MDYSDEQRADFGARATPFQEEFKQMYDALKAKHECELVYSIESILIAPGIYGSKVKENVGDLKFKVIPSVMSDEIISE